MTIVLLIIQVLLALGIIGLVLIQRSDSDGFGMGSGSGFGVISGRAKASLLTRATAILAGLFMFNSLLLAILTAEENSSSLLDRLPDTPAAVEQTLPMEAEEKGDAQQVPTDADVPVTSQEGASSPPAEAEEAEQAPATAPVVPRAE